MHIPVLFAADLSEKSPLSGRTRPFVKQQLHTMRVVQSTSAIGNHLVDAVWNYIAQIKHNVEYAMHHDVTKNHVNQILHFSSMRPAHEAFVPAHFYTP